MKDSHKTHYEDLFHRDKAHTPCGRQVRWNLTTTDKEKVTCKLCPSIMAKHQPEEVSQ